MNIKKLLEEITFNSETKIEFYLGLYESKKFAHEKAAELLSLDCINTVSISKSNPLDTNDNERPYQIKGTLNVADLIEEMLGL